MAAILNHQEPQVYPHLDSPPPNSLAKPSGLLPVCRGLCAAIMNHQSQSVGQSITPAGVLLHF